MLICFLDFYVCVIDVPDCDYFTFQKCFLSKMFVCVCFLGVCVHIHICVHILRKDLAKLCWEQFGSCVLRISSEEVEFAHHNENEAVIMKESQTMVDVMTSLLVDTDDVRNFLIYTVYTVLFDLIFSGGSNLSMF